MSLLRVGDWVRVNPLYKKAHTGVGHILDANYAEDPPHLILEARVRFPLWNGQGYWYAAGDLLPLLGWEELRVFDAALAKLDVDAGARAELGSARARALADGCPERSIGLLSRLWAVRPFGLEEVLGEDPARVIAGPTSPAPWSPPVLPSPAECVPKVARAPRREARPRPVGLSKRQQKKAAYRERLAAAKAAKVTRDQLAGLWRVTNLGRKYTLHVREDMARPLVGLSGWRVFDACGNEVTLDARGNAVTLDGRSLQDQAKDKMGRGDFQGALADSLAALKRTLEMAAPRDDGPPRDALGERSDALPPGNAGVDW